MKQTKNSQYKVVGVVFNKENNIETPIGEFFKEKSIEEQKNWASKIETDILSKLYNSKINFTY